MASVFASPVEIFVSSFSNVCDESSGATLALLRAEVGTRCWIIVLLTAYLNDGDPPDGEDSEIKERRMEFCRKVCQDWMLDCWERSKRTMIVVFHDSVFECS